MKTSKKILLALSVLGLSAFSANAKGLSGAGSSFAYPIISSWAQTYNADKGIEVNYQSIGSSGGIKAIKSNTVNFGASDAPMKEADLKKYNLFQFPVIMGGIVLSYNIPGMESGKLKLNGQTVADIFLGKIKKWNDSRIAALNKGVNLPNRPIIVVHRSDGSGTTYNFAQYLSLVSKEWNDRVGVGKSLKWPAGLGGKGNAGVAANITKLKYSIGYIEYAYAKENNIAVAQLKNRSGHFVYPSSKAFAAAADNANWDAAYGYAISLNNQPGMHSWPITAPTFVLVPKSSKYSYNTKRVFKFFNWAFGEKGAKIADSLAYIPLPNSLVSKIKADQRKIK